MLIQEPYFREVAHLGLWSSLRVKNHYLSQSNNYKSIIKNETGFQDYEYYIHTYIYISYGYSFFG